MRARPADGTPLAETERCMWCFGWSAIGERAVPWHWHSQRLHFLCPRCFDGYKRAILRL